MIDFDEGLAGTLPTGNGAGGLVSAGDSVKTMRFVRQKTPCKRKN